jgi:hypothetical protein
MDRSGEVTVVYEVATDRRRVGADGDKPVAGVVCRCRTANPEPVTTNHDGPAPGASGADDEGRTAGADGGRRHMIPIYLYIRIEEAKMGHFWEN